MFYTEHMFPVKEGNYPFEGEGLRKAKAGLAPGLRAVETAATKTV